MQPSYDDLHLFTETVIHGGISAAAAANGLQRSKVSRRLQELERALGSSLLIRTTRTIELTEQGQRLFELVNQPYQQLQQGLSVMREHQSEQGGVVRIAIPAALISSIAIGQVIRTFSSQYPQVQLQVESRQQSVDLKRERFDLQLLPSVTKVADDSYVQFSILAYRSKFVASAQYLEKHAPITSLEDLNHHRLFTNRYGAELLDDSLTIALRSDDLNVVRNMAIDGSGVAFIPEVHANLGIAQRQLVEVLNDTVMPRQHLTLIYPSALFLPKKVKALIELFRQQFQ